MRSRVRVHGGPNLDGGCRHGASESDSPGPPAWTLTPGRNSYPARVGIPTTPSESLKGASS
eukprot:1862163-Rhodomonas_salina.1